MCINHIAITFYLLYTITRHVNFFQPDIFMTIIFTFNSKSLTTPPLTFPKLIGETKFYRVTGIVRGTFNQKNNQ